MPNSIILPFFFRLPFPAKVTWLFPMLFGNCNWWGKNGLICFQRLLCNFARQWLLDEVRLIFFLQLTAPSSTPSPAVQYHQYCPNPPPAHPGLDKTREVSQQKQSCPSSILLGRFSRERIYSRQIAFVLQRWINTLPGCCSEILKRKCNSRIMVVWENLIGTEEQMILSSVFTFSWYTWSLFFCLGLDDVMELVYVLLQKGALSFSLVVWTLTISNKPYWQFMKSSPANPAFWEHRCCNLLAADGLIIEEVSAMSQVAGSGLGLIPYPCHTLVDLARPEASVAGW